jgi:hypothetical protein
MEMLLLWPTKADQLSRLYACVYIWCFILVLMREWNDCTRHKSILKLKMKLSFCLSFSFFKLKIQNE